MLDEFGNWMRKRVVDFDAWWDAEGKDSAPPLVRPTV